MSQQFWAAELGSKVEKKRTFIGTMPPMTPWTWSCRDTNSLSISRSLVTTAEAKITLFIKSLHSFVDKTGY